jgi:hypothetical protein
VRRRPCKGGAAGDLLMLDWAKKDHSYQQLLSMGAEAGTAKWYKYLPAWSELSQFPRHEVHLGVAELHAVVELPRSCWDNLWDGWPVPAKKESDECHFVMFKEGDRVDKVSTLRVMLTPLAVRFHALKGDALDGVEWPPPPRYELQDSPYIKLVSRLTRGRDDLTPPLPEPPEEASWGDALLESVLAAYVPAVNGAPLPAGVGGSAAEFSEEVHCELSACARCESSHEAQPPAHTQKFSVQLFGGAKDLFTFPRL